MANIKISELAALAPPDAADLVPVTDSSANQTKRTTVGEIVGIVNGDVEVANDGTATISELPVSKLQDGAARQLLQTDAAGTGVEWTSNVDLPGTLDVTGAATLDSTLGVSGQSTLASAAVSDLTSGRVVLAGTSGELEDNAALAFNGTQLDVDGDVVITGDLTVEGASTILETETVKVEDKNIELGVVGTPTDTTADGGGITLKGATDKTINWVDATGAWTFSEHVDIASAKEFRIAGTKVLDATTLGSGVVNSSLTSVGTLTGGALGTGFTTVATDQGGTGQTTYSNGELLIGKTDGTLAKATLTAGTGISVTNGSGSIAVAIDSSVVTTSDTGTVTSTMILDDTIVNGDINDSAAIAGTKIDPDFGSQTVETTGVINAGSGTEAAPSVSVGTTDNGLYSPGTNQVAISTNGAQALYIDSDGDILVADGNRMEIDEIRARDGAGLKLFDDGGAGIFIEDGGNVGLGNSGPRGAVHIGADLAGGATDAAAINIKQTSTTKANGIYLERSADRKGHYIYISSTEDALTFERNNTGTSAVTMVMDRNGKVGINTASPSEVLDVSGNVTISGSISKGSGSFKITHPLETKKDTHYLVHSFIEGPRADLIYRGTAKLTNGKAVINLDLESNMTAGTFEALCTNVSCFTSNETDWTPVKGSVSKNKLTIVAQDTTSNATVSWLVIGERKDPHMLEANWTDKNGRIIVEPEKEEV